jgi:dihydroneopterin aldolase
VIDTDFSKASQTDELHDAIDYTEIYEAVKMQMAVPSKLLEHLAEKIIVAVYGVSDNIIKVTIKVSKMNPAIGGKIERFCVVLSK